MYNVVVARINKVANKFLPAFFIFSLIAQPLAVFGQSTPTEQPEDLQLIEFKNRLSDSSSQSGAFLEAYQVNVPRGVNNIQPDLSLTYNSSNRNNASAYGAGWEDNIPYIYTENKKGLQSMYEDGYYASSLDGELILKSGNEYVPRVESGAFNKYEKLTNGWRITTKDGTQYLFGETIQARQDNPNDTTQVAKWMLERTSDVNGNTVRYFYEKDQNFIYPLLITYTNSTPNSLDGIYKINFEYSAREDSVTRSQLGFPVSVQKLISKISVSENDIVFASHDLSFSEREDATKKAMLNSITPSVMNQQDILSPESPVVFDYSNGQTNGWTHDTSFEIPSVVSSDDGYVYYQMEFTQNAYMFEANGDGLPDFMHASYSGAAAEHQPGVYINNGSGWEYDTEWVPPIRMRQTRYNRMVDVNGDGRDDYITSIPGNTGGMLVYINTEKTWELDPTWKAHDLDGSIRFFDFYNRNTFADVNGDGLVDFLHQNYGVYINNGSGWVEDTSWSFPTIDYHLYGRAMDYKYTDINGDGLVDLFIPYNGTINALNDERNKVFLNNGSGWTEDVDWEFPKLLYPGGVYQYYMPFSWAGSLADINGDGLPDYISVRPGSVDNSAAYMNAVYINNGSGWVSDPTWQPLIEDGNYPIRLRETGQIIDVNGDGYDDFLKARQSPHPNDNGVFINNNNSHSLHKVTDKLGGERTVTYTPASLQDIENQLGYSPQVVTKIQFDDKHGNIWSESYKYHGGDTYYGGAHDRRPSGFENIVRIDETGKMTTTFYHQGNDSNPDFDEPVDVFEKIGRPYKVQIIDTDSAKLRYEQFNEWDVQTTTRGNNMVTLASSVERQYGEDDSYKESGTEYVYDLDHGGVLTEKSLGEISFDETAFTITDIGTDKKTVTTQYATSTGLVLPKQVSLLDYNTQIVSDKKLYYDNLPFGQVGTGNVTTQSDWLDTDDTWLDSTYTYNSAGLTLTETDARGNTTTYGYDSDNLYPQTITNELGHITTNEYDYSVGQISKTTDPNGVFVETIFDGLGRVIEKKQSTPAGGSVTVETHVYDDTSMPRSVHTQRYVTASPQDAYTYLDGFGRTVQTKIETSNGDYSTVTYTYDNSGRLVSETLPYVSATSNYEQVIPTGTPEKTYTYDVLDRITTTTAPTGTESVEYGAWEQTHINKRGSQTLHIFDAFGNLISVTETIEASAVQTGGETGTETGTSTAYQYKKAITINGSAGAGNGYQTLIKVGANLLTSGADVHTNGNAQHFPQTRNDGGDLAFYNAAEDAMLNFWVEKVENDVAYIWVKVEDNLDTDTDIYLYYGHANPTNFSDGEGTFELFDEFDASVLDTNRWTTSGSGSVNITNGDILNFNDTIALLSKDHFGPGYAARFGARIAQTWVSYHDFGFRCGLDVSENQKCDGNRSGAAAFVSHWENDPIADTYTFDDNNNRVYGAFSPNYVNAQHTFEVQRPTGTLQRYFFNDEIKVTKNEIATNELSFKANQYGTGKQGNNELDWVAIRKVIDVEPEVGATGSEESIATVHNKYRALVTTTDSAVDLGEPAQLEEEIKQAEQELVLTGEAQQDTATVTTPEVSQEPSTPETAPEEIPLAPEELLADTTEEVVIEEQASQTESPTDAATATTSVTDDVATTTLDQPNEQAATTTEPTPAEIILNLNDDENEGNLYVTEGPEISEESPEVATATDTQATVTQEQSTSTAADMLDTEQIISVTATTTVADNIAPEELVTEQQTQRQKPAKGYRYKELVWPLEGKMTKKEARQEAIKNKLLVEKQTYANLQSALDKKQKRLSEQKETKNKNKSKTEKGIKESQEKIDKLKTKAVRTQNKIKQLESQLDKQGRAANNQDVIDPDLVESKPPIDQEQDTSDLDRILKKLIKGLSFWAPTVAHAQSTPTTAVTVYEYDTQNNLVKVIDAEDNEREFVYDSLNRLVSSELVHEPGAAAATYTYEYDAVGNRISETRPDGTVIAYTYDDINRITHVDEPTESGYEVRYTYDNAASNGIGKVFQIIGDGFIKVHYYQPGGMLDQDAFVKDGVWHRTFYYHNDQGTLYKWKYSDNTIVEHTLDHTSAITKVTRNGADVISNIDYNHLGQMTAQDYTNGISQAYTYDPTEEYRLAHKTTNDGTADLEDLSYTYDPVGNITRIQNTGSQQRYDKTYEYDSIDRLTHARSVYAQTADDQTRKQDLLDIADALYQHYDEHGTFQVAGGYNAQGSGWFNHENGTTYPQSVGQELYDLGYADRVIIDPTGVDKSSAPLDQSGYMILAPASGNFTLWTNLDNPTDADKATMDHCLRDNYDNYSSSWPESRQMNYCISGTPDGLEAAGVDSYIYSETGNILAHNKQDYEYDNPTFPHAATEYKGHVYTYDANGNLAVKDDAYGNTQTYSYDWNDRLGSIQSTGSVSGNSTDDLQRKQDLKDITDALDAYYTDHGTFKVAGSGYNGVGFGWFNYENGTTYAQSVAQELYDLGYTDRVIIDPTGVVSSSGSLDQTGYLIKPSNTGYTVWANLDNPTDLDKDTQNHCESSTFDSYASSYPESRQTNYCVSGDTTGAIQPTATTTATYTYDDQRQRITKTVGSNTTLYPNMYTEYNGVDYETFIFAGDNRVASVDTQGIITFNHQDHLQSSTLQTDSTGAVTSATTYTPFGSTENQTGTAAHNYTFTDQHQDIESDLMYYNSRYYDPELKRFTSVDPVIINRLGVRHLVNPQKFNPYTYTLNNPMKYVDPTGEEEVDWADFALMIATFGLLGGAQQAGEDADPDYSSSHGVVQDITGNEDFSKSLGGAAFAFALETVASKGKNIIKSTSNKIGGFFTRTANTSYDHIWSPGTFGDSLTNFQDHFTRQAHKLGIDDPNDYLEISQNWKNATGDSILRHTDNNGVLRVLDTNTGLFGSYAPNGATKTFFPVKEENMDRYVENLSK